MTKFITNDKTMVHNSTIICSQSIK